MTSFASPSVHSGPFLYKRTHVSGHDLFETKLVWKGDFRIHKSSCPTCHRSHKIEKLPKSPGEWVCSYCGGKTVTKYIATGHDHTDYSYATCNCDGASEHGKPWGKLI